MTTKTSSNANKIWSLNLVLRLCLILVAALALGWALTSGAVRDHEGFLTGLSVLPATIVTASILAAVFLFGKFKAAAAWLILALVGQAAALQFIVAGSALRYQHYRPLETLPVLLLFILFQTMCVATGLAYQRKRISAWMRGVMSPWRWIGVLVIFVMLPSATVSPQIPVYLLELCFAAFIQMLSLATWLLFMFSIPESTVDSIGRQLSSIFGGNESQRADAPVRLDRFAFIVAIAVILLAAALNVLSYQQHPHVTDEVAYLYHARFFANGILKAPAPPVPEAFEVYLMHVVDDIWYPSPLPGWPIILALGARVGLEWMVNPILAGLNTLLIYLLLQQLHTRRLARLAILLFALSPWYIFLGMSFMTHMFTLTCALLATLAVLRSRRTGHVIYGWLGGLALGMMALIRPLEALAMALLLGLWAIGLGGKRLKWGAIAGLVLGSILMGSVQLAYNAYMTGDPTGFPIMVYTDQFFGPKANAYGFGPDRGMGWAIDPYPGHSPRDAIINANLNGFMLNVELFGWGMGSLFLVGVLLFSGRYVRSDYLMVAVIALIFGLHFFYYFSGGPDFGARYWFLMIVPLITLTVRGMEALERAHGTASQRILPTVLMVGLVSLLTFFPWRAIDKYHHFRGMRPDVRTIMQENDLGRALVLIRGDSNPDYASAAVYNSLDLQAAAPIYAWDRDSATLAAVLDAYPDRDVWLVDGPTVTGRGYEIAAGPLTPTQALELSAEREHANE